MPTIEKKPKPNSAIQCSHCDNKIDYPYYNVGFKAVCDECFEDNYSSLVKCSIDGCNEYDEKSNLIKGMCESCYEVNSPLSPEEQEGWEHNIRKWNEG
ncbi:TPA: hypothetical protein ACXNO4_001433 [Proteus mirabilis]